MKRLLLFLILTFRTFLFSAQNLCDEKNILATEKTFAKAEKKGKTDNYEFADLTFNIAECYRLKDDTICLKWYRKNIIVANSAIKSCDRTKVIECNRTIGQIGISEFYLGRYQQSIRHLEIALTNSSNPIHNYFLGLAHMKLGNYNIAIVEFSNFKKSSTDQRDADNLINTCKDKLKGN